MGAVRIVVYSPGRCVCYQYIKITSETHFIGGHSGHHTQQVKLSSLLRILVWPVVVDRAALDPAEQSTLMFGEPAVQIDQSWISRGRMSPGRRIMRQVTVVAANVKHRYIEGADQEFEVVRGQVAATDDKVYRGQP